MLRSRLWDIDVIINYAACTRLLVVATCQLREKTEQQTVVGREHIIGQLELCETCFQS